MIEYISGFSDLINRFVAFRNASGSWNDISYGMNLKFFDHYCEKNYPGQELQQKMIDEWCSKRETESNRSYNCRILAIQAFINYLRDRNLTDVAAPISLKAEKKQYIPHAFTDEELKRFFYECDHINPSQTHGRVSAIRKLTCPVFFRLLYSSGIRTTEARLLKVDDVDLVHGILNIRASKGYDQHYVALHESITSLLSKYNDAIKQYEPDRTYFFESFKGNHYTRDWFQDNFEALWKKANGNVKAVAYDLRHHYATTNINSWNGDAFEFDDKLHYLSKSMGHRWIESTLYYYSIVPRLAETIREKTENGFNEIVPEVDYEEE